MSNQGGWGAPPGAPGHFGSGQGGPPPNAGAPGWGGRAPGSGSAFGAPPGGPSGGYPGAAPGAPFGGGPNVVAAWGPWEAVLFGWDRAKRDPGTVFGALIVGGIIANALSMVGGVVSGVDPTNQTLLYVSHALSFLNAFVSMFMMGGMTLFSLKVARGDPYEFADIFKGGPFFLSLLGAGILSAIGTLIGMLLLIVPGIIVALGLSIAYPLVVDRRLGAIDALKESWNRMNGHKLNMFLFGLLGGLIMLVAMLACCLPLLVAGPVLQVAFAYVYLRITGQQTAPLSTVA